MAYLFYKNVGNGGRLGNQLFNIAATIGIARANGMAPLFPSDWKYRKNFNIPDEMFGECQTSFVIEEEQYHYLPIEILYEDNIELRGYFQSEKYWLHCKDEILQYLKFSPEVYAKVAQMTNTGSTAISIRRGDFVNNPNYFQLPITYYILALMHGAFDEVGPAHFFSDDIAYCKHHFGCLPEAFFADGLNDIEQLCLMTHSQNFVISNSTFSWWGAYLGEAVGKEVVRPKQNLSGPLQEKNDEKDYWPERWNMFDHTGKKIDLRDVTFTVPVQIDHLDRKQNLDLAVCMLQRDFDTNVIVGEQGTDKAGYMAQYCRYIKFDFQHFHRTRMLNQMALMAGTPIIVNYDCDVLLPPMQICVAVYRLRTKAAQMVYPYDGRFCKVARKPWFAALESSLDTGIMTGQTFPGMRNEWGASVGGCVLVDRQAFIASGMENENFISYGPEDCERKDRWDMLGYTVERVTGPLYHIEHFRGIDSGTHCPHFKANHLLYDRIKALDKAALSEHVAAWPWVPVFPKPVEPKGYAGGWRVEDAVKEHAFSLELADTLSKLLDKKIPVYDFGCGPGFYTQFLRQRKFKATGYEFTDMADLSLTDKIIHADLSQPVAIKLPGQIICLELGEHMEAGHETQLLDNITNNAAGKIIISWAIPGQEGFGHVNCRDNSYIISKMAERQWHYNGAQSDKLRSKCSGCTWFENTLMVFEK